MDPRDYGAENFPGHVAARTVPDEPAPWPWLAKAALFLVVVFVALPAVNAGCWWLARWIEGWS